MMEPWEVSLTLAWKRQAHSGMEIVRHGIDFPSTELSHNAMNRTLGIINNLALRQVQQQRYMNIGFGSLSAFLALGVIMRVWYDSWRAQQLVFHLDSRRWAFLWNLHPAESFPLILGFTILTQTLSFIVIQAFALKTVFITNCETSSMVVFTQIFVLGWFHMVFGLSITLRAIKPPVLPAAPRRRIWPTLSLVGLSLILTLVTYLATRIRPAGDRCFGNIIFRSIKSSLLGIVFCTTMIPSFLIMAFIIGLRLYKTILMDHNERIAGTRMVWYLVETAIVYMMVLPFWIQAMNGTFDSSLSSSRVADFILCSSGAVICITHFFLRANAARTAIRPNRTPWVTKRKLRFFGPSDLELINISPPVMPKVEYEPDDKSNTASHSKIGMISSPARSSPSSSISYPPRPSPAALKKNWPLLDDMERPPTPAKSLIALNVVTSRAKHKKQANYSLFPDKDNITLPATVFSCAKTGASEAIVAAGTSMNATVTAAMAPSIPPSMSCTGDSLRDSTASTATLHIGMRLSAAPPTTTAAPAETIRLRDVVNSRVGGPFAPLPLKLNSTTRSTLIEASTKYVAQGDKYSQRRRRSVGSLDEATLPDSHAWFDSQKSELKSPENAERVASNYLTRKESKLRQAESNRQELTNLERSGSGASRGRLRPAYPHFSSPDSSPLGTQKGFF